MKVKRRVCSAALTLAMTLSLLVTMVLPAGAGVVGLVFLGRFLLQKYKSKKEWKEYNK